MTWAQNYDPLHNTLAFGQPKEVQLPVCVQIILSWLEKEAIPFSKIATTEPSLEQVFIALTTEGDGHAIEPRNQLQMDLE